MALLRGLFRSLGFDPNDLVIYMRPQTGAEPEEDTKVKKFAELTKFVPRFDELVGASSSDPMLPELKAEFYTAYAMFAVPEWRSIVASVPTKSELERDVPSYSAEKVLAVLTAIQQIDAMMPGTFNSKVCDGSVSQLLERLAQVDTVET